MAGSERASELSPLAGPLATDSRAAEESFAYVVAALLGHRSEAATHLSTSFAHDPSLPAAHLLSGFALRVLGRNDLKVTIAQRIDAARAAIELRGRPARETALCDALALWNEGNGFAAAACLDQWLASNSTDILAFKLAHACRFMLGDSVGLLTTAEHVARTVDPDHPGYGYVQGCLAFALEETGDLERAERVGRGAVDAQPRDAWGVHAVAHVYYMGRRLTEGVAWLRARTKDLHGLNNFGAHLAWHEGLFLVEQGRARDALDLYDAQVVPDSDRDFRDLSNASSLLYRLERRGVPVGDRWRQLVEIARTRAHDHGLAFADLHYALVLGRAAPPGEARRFVRSMEEAAAVGTGDDARVLSDVGVPMASAIVDLMESGGEPLSALSLDYLEVQRVGGSHAQRRLFSWLREHAEEVSRAAGA